MNRRTRRALERAEKKTHKLQVQVCVLWVPSARAYIERYGTDGFRLVDRAELARCYCDDHASSAALAFFELFGVHAEVRPYRAGLHRQERRGGISDQLPMALQ
ncbi:MAG: hypothetical protein ABI423_06715 [Burkholderiales bacterium]